MYIKTVLLRCLALKWRILPEHSKRLFFTLSAIFCLLISSIAQNRTITGRVTDAKGQPVEGASVIVKGTTIGTITNSEGNFSLSVPATARTLQFSAVDMTTQEVQIRGATVDVTLVASGAGNLQEVVVVGYGTQNRRAFTGSAVKVDVKEFANLITPSVDKLLAGRAAGLQVTNASGLVNQPARIRVRGINSISGNNDPLIIVDGVPYFSGNFANTTLATTTNSNALADINPSDIESIDVLKDGASLAIYGSRGAAGVILITTKKGSKGRMRISYDGFLGFNSALKRFDLLNAQEFVTIANEKLVNSGFLPRAYMDSSNTQTDWQREVLVDNAPVHNHTLSVQGGLNKTAYYFSINFSDQQGVVFSNTNRAYRVKMNIDQEFTRFLKFGNNASLSRQFDTDQNNGANSLGGSIASSLIQLPNVSPYSKTHPTGYNIQYTPPGGTVPLNQMNPGANLQGVESNYYNVAFTLRHNQQTSDKYRIFNVSYLEITPVQFLTFRSQLSFDYLSDYSFQSWDPRHGDGFGSNGFVYNAGQQFTRLALQNFFNLNKRFDKHGFYLTAGHELSKTTSKFVTASGTNISDLFFIQQNLISNSIPAANQSLGGNLIKSANEALFARFNYDFNNKYFLQATVRRDGQSSLAPDFRYGTFPGVSVGWRVSQEGFWQNASTLRDVFSDVKLKASYAKVGNPLTGFPYLSTFGGVQYGGLTGIAQNLVGNPNLTWETSTKQDLGIEIAFLKNRFNLSLDVFKNDIDNLVLSVPTPLSAGVPGNAISQNIGTQQNKGVELAIGADVIRSKDFRWNVNGNFSNIKNKITSLYEVSGKPVSFIPNPSGTTATGGPPGNYNIIRVGDPINILYGYHFAGVNSSNGNPMYYKYDKGNPVLVQHNIPTGSFHFANSLSDPTLGTQTSLTFDDKINLGTTTPTWFGGVSSSMEYKGFGLDVLFRFSGGNKIMNYTRQEILLNMAFQNNGREILQRWTTPGQITNVPKLYQGQGNSVNQNQQAISRFVESGDYLRLQNLTLSYNLGADVLRTFSNGAISNVKFFVQGQNLAVWTKYSGADPDNITLLGIDGAISPQVRTLSLGVNVGF